MAQITTVNVNIQKKTQLIWYYNNISGHNYNLLQWLQPVT